MNQKRDDKIATILIVIDYAVQTIAVAAAAVVIIHFVVKYW